MHPNDQITLGTLRVALSKAEPNATVKLGGVNEGFPSEPMSYRGYYEDISFEPGPAKVDAASFLARVNDIIGSTFIGYKGGKYVMDESTPIWVAHYGSSGNAVVDISVTREDVTLVTRTIVD